MEKIVQIAIIDGSNAFILLERFKKAALKQGWTEADFAALYVLKANFLEVLFTSNQKSKK